MLLSTVRRITTVALVVVLLGILLPIPRAGAAPIDLSPDHWAYADLTDLYNKGILGGYPDHTIRPDENITRAEFAMLLNMTVKPQFRPPYQGQFTDVKDTDWFAAPATIAALTGYIRGDERGRFLPNNLLTRNEAAVILDRVLGLPRAQGTTFTDANSVPGWAAEGVAAVAAAGYLKGYPDGSFGGQRQITRAEAGVLIRRALDQIMARMPRLVQLTAIWNVGAMNNATFRIRPYGSTLEYQTYATAVNDNKMFVALRPGIYEGWVTNQFGIGHGKFTVPEHEAYIDLAAGVGATKPALGISGPGSIELGQASQLMFTVADPGPYAPCYEMRIALSVSRLSDSSPVAPDDLTIAYLDPADGQYHSLALTSDQAGVVVGVYNPPEGIVLTQGLHGEYPLQVTINRSGTYKIDAYLWTATTEMLWGLPVALTVTAP